MTRIALALFCTLLVVFPTCAFTTIGDLPETIARVDGRSLMLGRPDKSIAYLFCCFTFSICLAHGRLPPDQKD